MSIQQTIERLFAIRRKGMARALEEQLQRGEAEALGFDERVALIVDHEWLLREERRTTRRLKGAKLKQQACAEDIDYRYPRGLDRVLMQDLLNAHWIRSHRNLIITGATGLGKTWLSCAMGDKPCRDGFSLEYRRVPRQLTELAIARADGTCLELLANSR